MPLHAEKRLLPYSCEQLFDLVVGIEKYPEFLPWCLAARIRSRRDNVIIADLVIGFRMFRERFTSEVTIERPRRIDVSYTEGPLRYLHNHWSFEATSEGHCLIDFHVDFAFRSALLERLIGVVFHEAVRRMVDAFEGRAKALYGPPLPVPRALTPQRAPGEG
ncbi:MAG: type II toxin-antitoxin system RatA family toxin [Alphaproteobacteria bacterium]|nr:type II toxin-antitoxin system RatA family toxin [Alphaproteobacteria bacterium]